MGAAAPNTSTIKERFEAFEISSYVLNYCMPSSPFFIATFTQHFLAHLCVSFLHTLIAPNASALLALGGVFTAPLAHVGVAHDTLRHSVVFAALAIHFV